MATNHKGPGKSRSVPKPSPLSEPEELISLKDELEAETVGLEPAEADDVVAFSPAEIESIDTIEAIAAEPVPEPVALGTSVAVAIVATPAPLQPATSGGVVSAELDPGAWSLKTFDLFNENAAAVFDLAVALGKAESVSDALELQSRFVSERYSTLVKQAGEFAELTRRLAFEASAPVRLSISAFVA